MIPSILSIAGSGIFSQYPRQTGVFCQFETSEYFHQVNLGEGVPVPVTALR